MTERTQAPLLVLGSAIAMTAAGSAEATLISKAPVGFAPVTITAQGSTVYTFDMDGDGTNDFSLFGGTDLAGAPAIQLGELNDDSVANTFAAIVLSTPNPEGAVVSVKNDSNAYFRNNSDPATDPFQPNVSTYAVLGTHYVEATYDSFNNELTPETYTRGYLRGIYSPGATSADDSFLLQDFGVVAAPEPATWLMMVAGFGGIGAMRRRQRTEAAQRAAA